MKKWLITVLILSLFLTACGSGGSSNDDNKEPIDTEAVVEDPDSGSLSEFDLRLSDLGSFAATFTLEFGGDTNWIYTLVTRYDGDLVEYDMQITGIVGAENPGDIRLVNDNGINKMIGDGTDNQCMQFPDSFGLNDMFLSPSDVVNPVEFDNSPKDQGAKDILGLSTTEFQADQDDLDDWDEVEITYWVAEDSGAVVRFEIAGEGRDPVFKAGEGTITGTFEVTELDAQEIQPVEGCDIILPTPDDASDFLVLPGLFAFQTDLSRLDLNEYLHAALQAEGWQRLTLPQYNAEGDYIVSYISDTERILINGEPKGSALWVEMFISDR